MQKHTAAICHGNSLVTRRVGDTVVKFGATVDAATLHDNGREQDELEKTGSSIRNLRPSEMKMRLDSDMDRSWVRVGLRTN